MMLSNVGTLVFTLAGSSGPAVSADAAEACRLAQNLARNRSYPVFPCLDTKAPATRRGFKDAETDPVAIARSWQETPGPLIGVPTGERSNFDVLDVDVKHSAARAWLITAQAKLPATRTFRTRSGGVHLLFQHAVGVRNTESHLARGVDTRGEGGYVIWWFAAGFPCVDQSPVADWQPWLLESLFNKPEPEALPRRSRGAYCIGNSSAQELISRTLQRLSATAEGHRQ
jgi:hypothetical protein